MADYAELLATKSAELAELMKAFNQHRHEDAYRIASSIGWDMAQLSFMATRLGNLREPNILLRNGL